MEDHLVYMLSKIQYVRITDSKFKELSDTVLEVLRKHYPLVQPKRDVQSMQIDFGANGKPEFQQTSEPVLSLISANKDWGIIISPENLILHSKKYGGFEDFKARISLILSTIGEIFNISHTSFIGMRFINTFEYTEAYEFSDCFKKLDFLQPEIDDWRRAGSIMTSRYVIDNKMVNINSGVIINGPLLSPELFELSSDLGDFSKIINGPVAHLDIDSCYPSESVLQEFNVDEILSTLHTLRTNSNIAFHSIVKID